MKEEAAWNRSSLLLKNILQNTQTLQLITKNNKSESIIKVIKRPSRKAWVQGPSGLFKEGWSARA
jgi:hypothetical protein